MSYHVTILRTQGGDLKPILSAEIKATVVSIPRLGIRETLNGCLEISLLENGHQKALLIWKNGEIWTKNPDRETLQVMLDLAERLKARVRGDELETYRTPEEIYKHPDDRVLIEASRKNVKQLIRKPKYKMWLLNGAILGGFILLGLLASYLSR